MHLHFSNKVVPIMPTQDADRKLTASRNGSRGQSVTPYTLNSPNLITSISTNTRPNEQPKGGSYLEDLDYTTKNLTTTKSPQNATTGLFNKGNAFNFTRNQRNTPSPGEGLSRNMHSKLRGTVLANTAVQNLSNTSGPSKPQVPNDKDSGFQRFGTSFSKNAKPIFGESGQITDSKAKNQESVVSQIAAQIIYTSKNTNDGGSVKHYEEKKQFKDRYQHGPIEQHKSTKDYMLETKATTVEKSIIQTEKQSEITNERIIFPRPSSRTIVRDVTVAFKETEKQTESSYPNSFRITTMQNGSNISESSKKSQISTTDTTYKESTANTDTNSKKSTANYVNDREYDSKSSKNVTSEEPHGLIGLKNIGNTCFMNSTLQCVFNLRGFPEYFLKGLYEKDLQPKHKGVAEQFACLLKKVRKHKGRPSNSGESTYSLKRAIEKCNSTFSGYDQQDAQELLKALLEGINQDCNRVKKKNPYKELKIDNKLTIQQNGDEWFNYNLSRDNSAVTDFFCGQLMSKITCKTCQHASLAFDNFWDLSLSFTRSLGMLDSCDLERMIEHFLKEEQLEDLFTCEKCKKPRKSTKKFAIWRIPQILVIHLKRFHYGKYKREKIRHNVIFPVEGLNLKQFIEESTDASTNDTIYDLVGIVNHSGDLYGGHYTAECMNPQDKKWYNFNDDHVRDVGDEIIKRYQKTGGASPYILFYCKRSLLQK